MTIYQRMEAIFQVADVPGFLQEWRKTDEWPELPEIYAAYNLTVERPAQCADDREIFRRYDVAIWVYGTEDVSAAVEAICDALTMDGFALPRESDGYARVNGDHIYVKKIETVFVDFGEYGA